MSLNFLKNYDEKIHFLLQITIFLVGVIFITAMFVYPDDYSFFDNFLSDLGRTVTIPSGNPNPDASALFALAMTLGGVSLFFFFVSSHYPFKLLKSGNEADTNLKLGTLFGIASSPFMAIIGFVHLDTMEIEHYITGIIFFVCICLSMIFFSIYFIRNTKISKLHVFFQFIVIGVFSFIFIYANEISTQLGAFRNFGYVLFFLFSIALVFLSVFYKLKSDKSVPSPKIEGFINFSSLAVSFYMLFVIFLTILFMLITQDVKPVFEVLLVWSFLLWALINNFRALTLSYRTHA